MTDTLNPPGTNRFFQFGQHRPEYEVPVLNERAVRASAGILFALALVSFMNAWLMGNFQPTRVFVVAFLVDFTLRIFVNPLYAPSLILGQWVVRRQQPEYVGAPQKRFAWAIGFALALAMLYLVVIKHVIGPVNLIVCAICLLLLFFEAAFGICLGCKIFNFFNKEKAQLCPGGACELPDVDKHTMRPLQGIIMLAFLVLVAVVWQWVYSARAAQPLAAATPTEAVTSSASADPAEAEPCKVPDFAKAMGHETQWKLHNNCK
jgi:hypothetical protein